MTLLAIPRSIWALGLVSMLMDTSSEMIHGLLPVFLVSVLGASTLSVGLIEGIAEATASITKIFSGTLSDYLRGTAFGVFNLVSGSAMLVASVLAGWLWDQYSAPATFYAGAGFAALGLLGFSKTLTGRSQGA